MQLGELAGVSGLEPHMPALRELGPRGIGRRRFPWHTRPVLVVVSDRASTRAPPERMMRW